MNIDINRSEPPCNKTSKRNERFKIEMKRQSMASRRNTIASGMRSRQTSHLNAQVAQLQANIANMESHMQVTIAQAEYIRKLGLIHGSLLMGSHKVFEEEEAQAGEEEEQAEVKKEDS